MQISLLQTTFFRSKLLLTLLVIMLTLFSACKKQETGVPKALQEYLSNQGVQETIVDLDYTSPSVPDKKYVSITVTYNFSTSSGKPQKEFLGFILKTEGNDWQIERKTTYTVNTQKAKDLLAGNLK